MRKSAAFSLIELIVVIAIVAVLAAILFPVFSQVKVRAKHTAWIQSVRQVNLANNLYLADYDDFFAIPRYNPAANNPAFDRTWVQVVLPYVKNFDVFNCPSDGTKTGELRSTFDEDIVPGDIYSRYYRASMRTNIGYNYIYLSPIIRGNANQWITIPKSVTAVGDPGNTLMFGDSAWAVRNSQPRGGGHYLVLAPCRLENVNGQIVDTTGHAVSNGSFFREGLIWVQTANKFFEAGGLWPWHGDRVTVTMVGGNIKLMSLPQTAQGCNVRTDWNGLISDPTRYIWDIR